MIRHGLDGNEEVVTSGLTRVRAGQAVVPQRMAATAAAVVSPAPGSASGSAPGSIPGPAATAEARP
uniref:hypothetical protein n=1 Tax=Siccirubricoccus phaeus TaxID=2595053 RepID=UPI001A9C8E55